MVAVAITAILAAYVLYIGLIFLAACVEIILTSSSWWSVIVTCAIFLPISAMIFGSGLYAADFPFRAVRLLRRSAYLLTDRNAFIATDYESECVIQRFGLDGMEPPEAFRLLESGVGDVVLDSRVVTLVGGDSDNSTAFFDRGFFAVPEAETVLELVEINEEMQEDYQGYLRRTGQL